MVREMSRRLAQDMHGFSTEALPLPAAGRMAPEHGVKGGLMAAVGLSAEAADARLKKEGLQGIVVGCDNSPSNVTLAGKPLSAHNEN